MTTKIHTCIIISCDVCDEKYAGDDEFTELHFDTVGEARTDAGHYQWFVAADGRALCGTNDPEHLKAAREWAAGQLAPDELESLGDAYPQLAPDDDADA